MPNQTSSPVYLRPGHEHCTGLLGSRADSRGRFHHDRRNRLPHDVVIVDETSMVSLTLMARLLEALGDDARLVLVGDPDQLSSIEAGAVLGDIAAQPLCRRRRARVGDREQRDLLDRTHRFGGESRGSRRLCAAAMPMPRSTRSRLQGEVNGSRRRPSGRGDPALDPVREAATAAGRAVIAAACERRRRLRRSKLSESSGCLRASPRPLRGLELEVERGAVAGPRDRADGGPTGDYPGRPLLITANDYDLNLFNGDSGVVVMDQGTRLAAVFEQHAAWPGCARTSLQPSNPSTR